MTGSRSTGAAFLPLLGRLLPKIVRSGSLTIIDYRGRKAVFGPASGKPASVIRFHDKWLPLKISLNPPLAVGEAYMNGRLTIEEGDLRGFLATVMEQLEPLYRMAFFHMANRFAKAAVRLVGGNRRNRARHNVAHHYDLSADFYRLFLDNQMQYSCGYFTNPDQSLDDAQVAKIRHLMAKLCLTAGLRVLDIGSGWGGLALAMSREAKVDVKGVTLSREQLNVASEDAVAQRLAHRVTFALEDYRDVQGRFDRIVSVGMLEHVGVAHFGEYFAKVAGLLDKQGIAVIHSIARWDDNSGPDPWTDKYIFPGGHIPSLSEVIPAIERSGLLITDIEILRLHYAETLRHWQERFAANRAEARAMYDERFCRMWEFYLAAAEMSFRSRPLMIVQFQLAHRRDSVPLTRDYIAEAERKLDHEAAPPLKYAA